MSQPLLVERRSPYETTVSLAFCSDDHMELPLHIAASSALRSLESGCCVRIYLMWSGSDGNITGRLRRTLDSVGRPYELLLLPTPDIKLFQGLRPFHGSYAAYYRLLLPQLIPHDRYLYLDTDIIVNIDLTPLMTVDMEGQPAGFVVDGTVNWSLERAFFLSQGLVATTPTFNSGVMLVDTDVWMRSEWTEKVLAFCHQHPRDLLAADQTALVCLMSTKCFHLAPEFNIKLSVVTRISIPERGVFHFVSSPKPWDLAGSYIHPNGELWRRACKYLPKRSFSESMMLVGSRWWRFPHIVGGYKRVVKQRFESWRDRRKHL